MLMANEHAHVPAGLFPGGLWLAALLANILLLPGVAAENPVDSRAAELLAEKGKRSQSHFGGLPDGCELRIRAAGVFRVLPL